MSKKEKFIEKLNIISKAWIEASEIWSEMSEEEAMAMEGGYPFQESFDEMYYDILAWKDQIAETSEE